MAQTLEACPACPVCHDLMYWPFQAEQCGHLICGLCVGYLYFCLLLLMFCLYTCFVLIIGLLTIKDFFRD